MAEETINITLPSIGGKVHYAAHGSKDGRHPQRCRPATVVEIGAWIAAEVDDPENKEQRIIQQRWDTTMLTLFVMTPTGIFTNQGSHLCVGENADPPTELCGGKSYCGGSWHLDPEA